MTSAPPPQRPNLSAAVGVSTKTAALRPVTLRAVVIGLALIPPNIVWIVLMEKVDGRAFSTTISLFFTAVFSLLLLTVGNHALRKFAPRRALRQGELLTVFSVLSVGTAMAGIDFAQALVCLMPHGTYFATPENNWASTFGAYLPRWLTVQDKEALQGYYLGNASLYHPTALRAWLPPIGAWTLFILVLLWVMACLNTILRAQWTEKERLTYPIVQLPLALTSEDGALFRARLFWIGFALAGGLNLVNGLHFLYPSVPALTFNGFDARQWFPSRPWDAIGWTPLAVFPFIVGLGYLLPVDLLFSCWFFFVFWRLEKVAASALGYAAENPKFPYIDEQMFGGYMAIGLFALWTARHHLKAVWRAAIAPPSFPAQGGQTSSPSPHAKEEQTPSLSSHTKEAQTSFPSPPYEGGARGGIQGGGGGSIQNPEEPMSFRAAVFGAAGGFLFLVGFSWLAGVPFGIGALFFLVYFAIAISITRMRAELGPPTHDLHFIGPYQSLTTIFGTRNLDKSTLAVFTLYYWFNRAYRCHPMPHQLEGFKMAQVTRTSSRGLLIGMMLGGLVGVLATFWVALHVSYELGAAARIRGWGSLGYGGEAYNRLSSWITSPTNPDTSATMAMGVGFLIAAGLILIKMNVYGWPFHALGFAISGGWSMSWAWLSLFVAWILKALILRYSGLKGYRAGLPFFFGAILGDFLIGGIWTLLGITLNIPIYSLWSG